MKTPSNLLPSLLALYGALHLAQAAPPADSPNPFEQDRAAILQLAGPFQVTFDFRESLAIQPDYQLKEPYREQAHELVLVVEDSGPRIVLQHLLVAQLKEGSPVVIKHWSQTWQYEDPHILDHRAKRHWRRKTMPAEQVKGTWTQLVSQVDDSPRYKNRGKWIHHPGRSLWTSALTTRPLPRREYTKRRDYDLLQGINRQVVTPQGWAHEQFNEKVVRRNDEPDSFIAHEIGLNTYLKDPEFDFSPASQYWETYGKYWGEVRAAWNTLYRQYDDLRLQHYHNDDTLREMITEQVEIAAEQNAPSLDQILPKIEAYLQAP